MTYHNDILVAHIEDQDDIRVQAQRWMADIRKLETKKVKNVPASGGVMPFGQDEIRRLSNRIKEALKVYERKAREEGNDKEYEYQEAYKGFSDANSFLEDISNRVAADAPLPAVVIVDLKLDPHDPDDTEGGLSIISSLRSNKEERVRNLPIVVLSSSMDPEEIAESYKRGANAYHKKGALKEFQLRFLASVLYWSGFVTVSERRFS